MSPRLLLAALLAVLPMPALAEGGISLAVAGGDLGVGPVAGVRLAPELGVHGDAALVAVSHHFQSGTAQDADHLKLRTAAMMLDLFPATGGIRLSLGARYEGEAAAAVRAAATAARRWASVGPAMTIGWTGRLGHGLVAVAEAGAMLRSAGPLALAARRAAPILKAQLGWRF